MKKHQLLLATVCCLLGLIVSCAESLPPSNNHVSGNETKSTATPHVSGAKSPGHVSGY
jgi:hypothetical protein